MKLELTEDPDWVSGLRERLKPFARGVVDSRLFSEMAEGTLAMVRFRGALLYFYPLVENFPKYMALTLAKAPEGHEVRTELVRNWLLENMNVERRHASWYRSWAVDFGVSPELLCQPVVPPAPVDAVNNYLWRVAGRESLAEALAAVNLGIEGPTGEWTKAVKASIRCYAHLPGVNFRSGTVTWLRAHATYDDAHPDEAIELIKHFALTSDEQLRVERAAIRSMEYYAMAADACYDLFE